MKSHRVGPESSIALLLLLALGCMTIYASCREPAIRLSNEPLTVESTESKTITTEISPAAMLDQCKTQLSAAEASIHEYNEIVHDMLAASEADHQREQDCLNSLSAPPPPEPSPATLEILNPQDWSHGDVEASEYGQ